MSSVVPINTINPEVAENKVAYSEVVADVGEDIIQSIKDGDLDPYLASEFADALQKYNLVRVSRYDERTGEQLRPPGVIARFFKSVVDRLDSWSLEERIRFGDMCKVNRVAVDMYMDRFGDMFSKKMDKGDDSIEAAVNVADEIAEDEYRKGVARQILTGRSSSSTDSGLDVSLPNLVLASVIEGELKKLTLPLVLPLK